MRRIKTHADLPRALLGAALLFILHSGIVHAQNYGYEYNADGNLTKVTDGLGQSQLQSYDALGRLTEQQSPAPNSSTARPITKLQYDKRDHLLSVTDPRSVATTYAVDGRGEVMQVVSPDAGTSTVTFDSNGNIKTSKDGRGVTATYGYDALNRLISITYPGWTGTLFEYDQGTGAVGRLSRMTDESGNTTYTYDGFGRVTGKTQTVVAGPYVRASTISYVYGKTGVATGKLTAVIYPSGNRINYQYGSSGKVESIVLNPAATNGSGTDTGTEIKILTGVTYAPFGPIAGWAWGNSTTVAPHTFNMTLDSSGRIEKYTLGKIGTTAVTRTLAYDAAGRISGYSHAGPTTASAMDQTFGYDTSGRLTSFISGTTTHAYKYDANGNRTELGIGANNYAFATSSTSNRLTSAAGPLPAKNYTYDGAGNIISDGTATYTYSPRGRLASYSIGGKVVYQLYNGLGQRVQKSNSGGVFVYDEQGLLIGEYDIATGRATRETVYLDGRPVALLTLPPTGSAPGSTTNVFYIHTDHLGTPRQITRATDGRIRWNWESDPFGMLPPNEDPSGIGVFPFNLRMPGQYVDRETNLFYNYFRDYDPQTGRYIESDPIGLGGGINTYGYVSGNPVSRFDPRGLDCVASGGTVSCNVPGGPHISFPRPQGWPDYIGPNSFGYHDYNESMNTAGPSKKCLEDYIRNHPTPGSPKPATPNGTYNDATPDYLSWYPGGSPVYSYSQMVGGQQVVVNVTQPGHPLFPGYVARTVDGGPNGSNVMNNFGEGTAFKQSGYNPLNSLINNVWQMANDAAFKACSCQH
jgi:RHS repeat-associated protein